MPCPRRLDAASTPSPATPPPRPPTAAAESPCSDLRGTARLDAAGRDDASLPSPLTLSWIAPAPSRQALRSPPPPPHQALGSSSVPQPDLRRALADSAVLDLACICLIYEQLLVELQDA